MRTRSYLLLLSTNTGYGSGKTTVAKAMQELDPTLDIISIATPLKEMVKSLLKSLGYRSTEVMQMLYDPEFKETPISGIGDGTVTPRRLMQTLGTEWRNMVDPDLWVKLTVQKVMSLRERGRNVCIDDVRFPHELTLFRSELFPGSPEVIHLNIDRPGHSKGVGQHASEAGLAGIEPDFQIINDGTIEELRFKVKDLFFFFPDVKE